MTDDGYTIVKLTEKSKGILSGEEKIQMKMPRQQDSPSKVQKMKKTRKGSGAAGDMGEREQNLFERLRILRAQIAKEEKVPPYIVFSDKTLVDMCLKKPASRKEMLDVSGVGEYKYEKYGERFLLCISEVSAIQRH